MRITPGVVLPPVSVVPVIMAPVPFGLSDGYRWRIRGWLFVHGGADAMDPASTTLRTGLLSFLMHIMPGRMSSLTVSETRTLQCVCSWFAEMVHDVRLRSVEPGPLTLY